MFLPTNNNFAGSVNTFVFGMHVQEARRLVEAGFEYVTEIEAAKVFRKRK
jgi:hypothetical protein